MGLGNYFIDKFRQTVRNVQINGPFYFYRNYFGQALNYINLRGGLVAYTHGYNNDPTDIFNPLINGTNYLEENLKRNGLFTVNEKYKASNQKIIDGYWPEKYEHKNTFSEQRNIGNIVNLDYSNIIDVRNKDYDFDNLQTALREHTFYVWDKDISKEYKRIFSYWAKDVQKDDEFKGVEIYKQKTDAQIKKDYQEFANEHIVGSTSTPLIYGQENKFYDETRSEINVTPKSLIEKTANFFKERKIKSIVSSFYSNDLDELDLSNELDSGYDREKYGYSRGRNLKKDKGTEAITGQNGEKYTNPYCRTWTAYHQYDRLSRRIRPFYDGVNAKSIDETQKEYGALRPNDGSIRLANNTVLDTSGFVRITPTQETKDNNHDIKKCMFSIENLAWKDIKLNEAKISKEQQGPNGGRIMWFPPYNLKFTENINVDWNANKFIGRGEQIYTYTNTDRSGTLNFTLLIDHPSILNKYVGNQKSAAAKDLEEDILRYFAGCGDLNGENRNNNDNQDNKNQNQANNINPQLQSQPQQIAIIAFFPNNWTGINYKNSKDAIDMLREYETDDDSGHTFTDMDEEGAFLSSEPNYNSGYKLNCFTKDDEIYGIIMEKYFKDKEDDKNFKLYSIFDNDYGIEKLAENITNEKLFGNLSKYHKLERTETRCFASSHGNNYELNQNIANRRGNLLVSYSRISCELLADVKNTQHTPEVTPVSDDEERVKKPYGNDNNEILDNNNSSDLTSKNQINTLDAKLARCAYIVFNIEWNKQTVPSDSLIGTDTHTVSEDDSKSTINSSSNNLNEYSSTVVEEKNEDYTYDNEYSYFQHIANDGKMQYEYIANKVKYFNPAFHSITPEGFNARLTFLHQCTRQGPTNDLSSGNINSESNSYLKYAGNLAFGRPPYCILRIGDFYNTKICITALSIDYDNGGGIQWDLNQEGIGVQPMFANISINFTFLGGQDLTGPIERLQNAVTANYYANASVYDDKADVRGEDGRMKQIYDPTINKKNS